MQAKILPFTPINIIKTSAIIGTSGIAVIPTDTIYGMVGQALNKKVVEKIYKLRQRNPKKPLIVLISNVSDLKKFSINLPTKDQAVLKKLWPGPVSVILPCLSKKLKYLHRGTNSLALRMPKSAWLRRLIEKTGPLVAPSANKQAYPEAENIAQAYAHFGNRVDAYLDAGPIRSKPSTLARLSNSQLKILRKGRGRIPRELLA